MPSRPRLRSYQPPIARRLRSLLAVDEEYEGLGRFVAFLRDGDADMTYCVFKKGDELVKYWDVEVFSAYLSS